MTRRLVAAALLGALALVGLVGPAQADEFGLGLDCKESPTPDMPGQGLAAFFDHPPKTPPPHEDPFAKGSSTTIYEQYGFAGLRYRTYDLGCGPDAARNPGAIVGTAVSNWVLNLPISLTALTGSITQVAFNPTFLDVFDPTIASVSQALHEGLFATWVPAVLALLGIAIMVKAHRSALASTAAAVGWATIVVLIATALFRWPVAAGNLADDAVTTTLGSVVDGLGGNTDKTPPGVAVTSNVQESLLYTSWLAGTLGSTDTPTARKYGPELFKAQALTWKQAAIVRSNPERGQQIIESKEARWAEVAEKIKNTDPAAYEHLTGKRSDTRIGYALLSAAGAVLALPFLLVSAFLLLGSFLIVRLAVMLFPAFATLGVFPAGRGLVLGIGRTVGAALVNAVVFGVGAAVTIRILGLILDPASKLPGWLSFVLLPLFTFVMWTALKPFRRLTHMVSPHSDHFGNAAGSFGDAGRKGTRLAKRVATTAAASYTGNVAAAATVASADDGEEKIPDRAEARPSSSVPTGGEQHSAEPRALPTADHPAPNDSSQSGGGAPTHPRGPQEPAGDDVPDDASTVRTSETGVPLPPTEPEWFDGEEVYPIYTPSSEGRDGDAA